MCELYETTIQMVNDSGLSLARIAAEAGLGHRWLCLVVSDPSRDPGVKKIQKLHDYLKARQEQQRMAA